MRTVATPAGGHCLLHAFIRTKEIKYGNSDPCNERENKLLELIKSMKNEYLLSKNIYSEFTTNVEELTKDMNDYLDRKVYSNYFADIAPMILATVTNTVLNIIDVDKTARRVHLTKIKPEQDQNQQIHSDIYLHTKNNHYSAMAAHKENHISSE